MRLDYRLAVAMLLASTACGGPTSPTATPPQTTTTPPPTTSPPPSTGGNCGSVTTVAPPAVGGTFASGTQTTFRQGGTYQLPAGTLRLTGTGAGRVVLNVSQGSTRSNAPFDLRFTGPGTMEFEPFQTAPESVTMTLCTP